jgi:hypothetical protein
MSRNKALYFLFILCSVISCKSKGSYQFEDVGLKEIYIDLSKNHTDFYDISNDIEPDFDIVALETNDACLIGNIRKIIYSNGLYYVQDDKGMSIFIFNNDGTFNSKLDKKGAGPDEYINIASFIVKNNDMWIYDDMTKRLLCYDTIFNKKEEIKIAIPAFDMSIVKDNILLSTNWFWYGEDSYQLKKYNIGSKETTEYALFSQMKQNDIVPIMKENQFAPLGDSCLFMFSHDNKLYQITDDDFIPLYKYTFSERFDDKSLTRKELYMESDLIRGINALYQTENSIIVKYDEKREPMIAIYNKETGDCNVYTSVFTNSEFGNFKIFKYFISTNQEIISLYDPEILINYGAEIYNRAEIKDMSNKQKLESVMSKIDVGDNPVIIKYKLAKKSKL